jgi:hypothetical protein
LPASTALPPVSASWPVSWARPESVAVVGRPNGSYWPVTLPLASTGAAYCVHWTTCSWAESKPLVSCSWTTALDTIRPRCFAIRKIAPGPVPDTGSVASVTSVKTLALADGTEALVPFVPLVPLVPLVPFVPLFPSWPVVRAGPCDPVAPATVSARRASRLADRAVRSALFAVFRGVAAATALCWAAAAGSAMAVALRARRRARQGPRPGIWIA